MTTIDPKIPRTWYFSAGNWSSESKDSQVRYQEIKTKAQQESQDDFVARIFLVRAPLTFGHSQLVLSFSGNNRPNEAEQFSKSSQIIKVAVSAFQKVFKDDTVSSRPEFEKLAKLTLTQDGYLKALILRASADEKADQEESQYKVHLVPYFESHASLCSKRYSSIHNVDLIETGGLLGWIGERETEVDNWQVGTNPFTATLDDIVNDHFKMPALAEALCRAY